MNVFPSGERTAKLCFDAQTAEEFDSRLSALGDLLTQLKVQARGSHHPLDQLQAFLLHRLDSGSHEAISRAVEVLQAVRRIRNAGQHTQAGHKALADWASLGLSYPPVSWSQAWQVVQSRTIEALDMIRQELPLEPHTEKQDVDRRIVSGTAMVDTDSNAPVG